MSGITGNMGNNNPYGNYSQRTQAASDNKMGSGGMNNINSDENTTKSTTRYDAESTNFSVGASGSTSASGVSVSSGVSIKVLDEATKQRGDNLFRKMEHAEYVLSMIKYAIENNIKLELKSSSGETFSIANVLLRDALDAAEKNYENAKTEFKNFKQKNPAYKEPSERMLTDFNFYAQNKSESEIRANIMSTVFELLFSNKYEPIKLEQRPLLH